MRPSSFRLPLYYILWILSGFLFAFVAVRLNYTTHLPQGDPLNHGVDFYDPIVVELLVCSILALGFVPFVLKLLDAFLPRVLLEIRASTAELIALSILWLLWLAGVGVSTSIWPNLSFCAQFSTCRVLSAMVAFAWLGWLTTCGLLALSVHQRVRSARESAADPQMVEWALPVGFAHPGSYASFDPPSVPSSAYLPSTRSGARSPAARTGSSDNLTPVPIRAPSTRRSL